MKTTVLRWSCLALIFATTGCGKTLVRESISAFPPDRVATRVALTNVNHGPCDVPGQLDRSVLSADSLPRPTGTQVIAGFNNHLIHGADPFPCNRQRSQDYTGAMHFDLSAATGTLVDSATLRLSRTPTTLPWAIGSSSAMSLVAVSRATSDWPAGYLSGGDGTTIPAVPFHRTAPSNRIDGGVAFDVGVSSLTLDVTKIVREWVAGRPNFGFIVHQEEENGATTGANDRSSTSIYTGTLEMTVHRAVPVAP